MMTNTRTTFRNRGFSLIEMLVYIFVFMLVSIGSVTMLFTLQDMVIEHRATQVLTRNMSNVMERLMLDIRAADSLGASTLGTDPGSITLVEVATTTAYSLSGDTLMMSVNGGTAVSLTSDQIGVTSLRFDHYDNGVSEAVRVSMTMEARFGSVVVSRDFTNTAVLLSSYD